MEYTYKYTNVFPTTVKVLQGKEIELISVSIWKNQQGASTKTGSD